MVGFVHFPPPEGKSPCPGDVPENLPQGKADTTVEKTKGVWKSALLYLIAFTGIGLVGLLIYYVFTYRKPEKRSVEPFEAEPSEPFEPAEVVQGMNLIREGRLDQKFSAAKVINENFEEAYAKLEPSKDLKKLIGRLQKVEKAIKDEEGNKLPAKEQVLGGLKNSRQRLIELIKEKFKQTEGFEEFSSIFEDDSFGEIYTSKVFLDCFTACYVIFQIKKDIETRTHVIVDGKRITSVVELGEIIREVFPKLPPLEQVRLLALFQQGIQKGEYKALQECFRADAESPCCFIARDPEVWATIRFDTRAKTVTISAPYFLRDLKEGRRISDSIRAVTTLDLKRSKGQVSSLCFTTKPSQCIEALDLAAAKTSKVTKTVLSPRGLDLDEKTLQRAEKSQPKFSQDLAEFQEIAMKVKELNKEQKSIDLEKFIKENYEFAKKQISRKEIEKKLERKGEKIVEDAIEREIKQELRRRIEEDFPRQDRFINGVRNSSSRVVERRIKEQFLEKSEEERFQILALFQQSFFGGVVLLHNKLEGRYAIAQNQESDSPTFKVTFSGQKREITGSFSYFILDVISNKKLALVRQTTTLDFFHPEDSSHHFTLEPIPESPSK